MVWYPIVFWLINMLTTVIGVPKAALKRRGTRAIWVSPDRGLQAQ
jgi:biofilm PGA synthesis N-glycosyltransferase PgaC